MTIRPLPAEQLKASKALPGDKGCRRIAIAAARVHNEPDLPPGVRAVARSPAPAPLSPCGESAASAELHHLRRGIYRGAAARRGDRRLVDPHAGRRKQPAQHKAGETPADMAGLAVLRLAALPQGPDAEAEAHRRGKVAGHAEGRAARVDRFARYRVELCANAARRGGRLRQRMTRISKTEGAATGDRREDLPPERREAPLVHGDPRVDGREFHASHSWIQREPPLVRKARRAVCERRAKK